MFGRNRNKDILSSPELKDAIGADNYDDVNSQLKAYLSESNLAIRMMMVILIFLVAPVILLDLYDYSYLMAMILSALVIGLFIPIMTYHKNNRHRKAVDMLKRLDKSDEQTRTYAVYVGSEFCYANINSDELVLMNQFGKSVTLPYKDIHTYAKVHNPDAMIDLHLLCSDNATILFNVVDDTDPSTEPSSSLNPMRALEQQIIFLREMNVKFREELIAALPKATNSSISAKIDYNSNRILRIEFAKLLLVIIILIMYQSSKEQ